MGSAVSLEVAPGANAGSRRTARTPDKRFTTCGKPNCICAQGQKHGPFYYLTAHLRTGKIVKSLLKTSAQQAAVQQGVAAYQSHWDALEELSQINLELLRRDEPLRGSQS
jgi:hypothetical protein